MPDTQLIDQAFQRIMRSLVETGRAPHYAELGRALGLPAEDGRACLRDVMAAYPIGWLHPETDYIASFPPLNSLPTQYRISVGGLQRWFAQCGFEATSATWLFPGQTVRVDAPCLDCGDPVTVEMRDGRITWVDPPGRRRPSRLRLRAVARATVLPLNRDEPLPVGRACAALEPVRAAVGAGLHRPWRSWPASSAPRAAGTCWTATISRRGIRGRAAERRAYLERIGKTSPFWMGTPDPPAS